MKEDKTITVYTREGKQELTWDEWENLDKSKLHREGDLPAVETVGGSRIWFKYGKRHREVGPAVVWSHGSRRYILGGWRYSTEDFYKKLREVDELPLSLALIHEEEWVRERAKRRLESE